MRQILIAIGLVPRGGNYELVKRRIESLGLSVPRMRAAAQTKVLRSQSRKELVDLIRSSRSFAQVLKRLGLKPGGRTHALLKERIGELGLDTSHFLGPAWRRGSRVAVVPARPLRELLTEGRLIQSNDLRRRLIQEGLKDARCEDCGLSTWNGRPIPLELDHLNGRRDDNRLSNLQILCPNCHAQTPTYRGRNIGLAALS
jgi:hypothetical protein